MADAAALPENGSASTASASTLVGVHAGISPAGSAANVSSDSDDAGYAFATSAAHAAPAVAAAAQ